MLSTFRTAIAALVVAAAGIGATAPAASANGFELRIGTPGATVVLGDTSRHQIRRGHRDHRDQRAYRDDRRDRFAGVCRPANAVQKARHMGVRRAGIVDISHRSVVVRGLKRGHPVFVTFANRRACPVVAYSR